MKHLARQILISALFLLVSTLTHSQVINDSEFELIEKVLNRAGLDIGSLNFQKDWVPSTDFKVEGIVDILNEPLLYPKLAEELQGLIKKQDLSPLNDFLVSFIFSEFISEPKFVSEYDRQYFQNYFDKSVHRASDLIEYGENLFSIAEHYYLEAMYGLSLKDKQALTYLSYSMWTDGNDWEKYEQELEFLPDYRELFTDYKRSDYRDIIKKIDWQAFTTAAQVFINGAEVLKENINEIDFNNENVIEEDTSWGRFVIGTNDDNIYHSGEPRIVFLIEPGGNNTYNCSFETNFISPYYLVLDAAGDSNWQNRSLGALLRVLGGIGWSASLGGRDIYEGGDLAFSSFAGFQYHQKSSAEDEFNNDTYNTGRYSQAAATFGISVIVNDSGNNVYNSTGYGQGFGGTLGAGLLIDHEGHDVYYAGGKYDHAPLRPEDHRSMAQGFGFGVRPDWGGGLGLLYDGDGNDTYTGSIYAQGVGYWYALGILLDGGGNDTFRAVQYAQGSGIHLAGGLLFNKSGDNSYYSRFGPGQGAGHDYAVGFLIDRSGDDHYSIDGGNGLGLTNSVGIFLDVEGDDRYERIRNSNYGYANQARDSGGIGIFLDTGGDDVYSDTLQANNDFWVRGTYGIGLDTTMVAAEDEPEDEIDPELENQLAEIDTMTVVADLFRIASEWQVGSSIERVDRARKRILEFDEQAAEYIYENKLGSQSGLEHRAILAFADESEYFADYLEKGLSHSDSLVVKNSISFAARLGEDDLFHYLADYLEQRKYVPTIILALSAFKTEEAAELLIPFIDSPNERIRFHTARSLKAMENDRSRELLTKMRDDESFLIRTAVKLALE